MLYPINGSAPISGEIAIVMWTGLQRPIFEGRRINNVLKLYDNRSAYRDPGACYGGSSLAAVVTGKN